MHKRHVDGKLVSSRRSQRDTPEADMRTHPSSRREASPRHLSVQARPPRRGRAEGCERQLPPGFSASLKPRPTDKQDNRTRGGGGSNENTPGASERAKKVEVKKESDFVGLPPHLKRPKRFDVRSKTVAVGGAKKLEIAVSSEPVNGVRSVMNPLLAQIGLESSHSSSQLYLARDVQISIRERVSEGSCSLVHADKGKILFDSSLGSLVHESMDDGSGRCVRRRSPTPVLSPQEIYQGMNSKNRILASPGSQSTEIHMHKPTKKQKIHDVDLVDVKINPQEQLPIAADGQDGHISIAGQIDENQALAVYHGRNEDPSDSLGHARAGEFASMMTRRPPISDQYIAELRLLLAERMHQALESSIGKGQGDCGVLEESIGVDYNGRFGRALNFLEAGFPTLKEMIRSTCLDIVQMQQLRAGAMVKMGLIPTPSFKADSRRVFADVRAAYSNLVLKHGSVLRSCDEPGEVMNCSELQSPQPKWTKPYASPQSQPKHSPELLEIMAKNMIESLARDITSGVWSSLPVSEFLKKFHNHYSVPLEARDLGYKSIEEFLSSQASGVFKILLIDGVTHLHLCDGYWKDKMNCQELLVSNKLTCLDHSMSMNQQFERSSKALVGPNGDAAGISNSDTAHEKQVPLMSGSRNCKGKGEHSRDLFQVPAFSICQQDRMKSGNPNSSLNKLCATTHPILGDGAGNDCDSISTMAAFPQRNPEMNGRKGLTTSHDTIANQSQNWTTVEQESSSHPDFCPRSTKQSFDARLDKATGWKDHAPAFIALPRCRSIQLESSQPKGENFNGDGSSMQGHPCTIQCARPSQSQKISRCHTIPEKVTAIKEEDVGMPENNCFQHLPTVLGKVQVLLEKLLTGPSTSLLLNKLPLLYFNRYNHVLDYVGFGFKNLTEMMNLLPDLFTITETPAGKLLVPNKKAGVVHTVRSLVVSESAQHSRREHQDIVQNVDQVCSMSGSPVVIDKRHQDGVGNLSHQNSPLMGPILVNNPTVHYDTSGVRAVLPLRTASFHHS